MFVCVFAYLLCVWLFICCCVALVRLEVGAELARLLRRGHLRELGVGPQLLPAGVVVVSRFMLLLLLSCMYMYGSLCVYIHIYIYIYICYSWFMFVSAWYALLVAGVVHVRAVQRAVVVQDGERVGLRAGRPRFACRAVCVCVHAT